MVSRGKFHSGVALIGAIGLIVSACSNPAGGGGSGSAPPGVPQVGAPGDGETGVAVGVDLTFSAEGATSVDVYFGETNPPPLIVSGLSTDTYDPAPLGDLDYNKPYYWKIVAANGGGSVEGPVWSFTTENEPPPGAPSLLSPANNLFTNSTSITLDWSDVADATSYRAHLGTSSSFAAASQEYSGSASQATLNGLADDTYYWWAESRNDGTGAGDTGPYTGPRVFTVDTVAPTITFTGGPSGPTNDSTPNFTFSVSGATGSPQCRIGSGAYGSCSSSTTYNPGYLSNGSYTAWVRAEDGAGNVRQVSRSFTVDTVAPSLTITSAPPDFQVNAGSATYYFSASGYTTLRCRLYLSSQTPPAYQSCSSPFTKSIGYGSYTFQVQAIDAAGNTTTRSDTFENQYLG